MQRLCVFVIELCLSLCVSLSLTMSLQKQSSFRWFGPQNVQPCRDLPFPVSALNGTQSRGYSNNTLRNSSKHFLLFYITFWVHPVTYMGRGNKIATRSQKYQSIHFWCTVFSAVFWQMCGFHVLRYQHQKVRHIDQWHKNINTSQKSEVLQSIILSGRILWQKVEIGQCWQMWHKGVSILHIRSAPALAPTGQPELLKI